MPLVVGLKGTPTGTKCITLNGLLEESRAFTESVLRLFTSMIPFKGNFFPLFGCNEVSQGVDHVSRPSLALMLLTIKCLPEQPTGFRVTDRTQHRRSQFGPVSHTENPPEQTLPNHAAVFIVSAEPKSQPLRHCSDRQCKPFIFNLLPHLRICLVPPSDWLIGHLIALMS